MDKIKKTVRYNSLLHIYGNLLSKTQYSFADAYFSYDLSLSEIAEAHDVSIQTPTKTKVTLTF